MHQHIELHSVVWAAVLLACAGVAAQQEPTYTIRVNSDLVQVTVVARDHGGQFVPDLTRGDFELKEDGRPQQLSALDLEKVGVPSDRGTPQPQLQLPILTSNAAVPPTAARGLRLVVLFFDFTSLDLPDAARALGAAEAYIYTIGPADRVAVVTLSPKLEVQQDFTGDQAVLQRALERLHGLSETVLEIDNRSYGLFYAYDRLRLLRVLTSTLARVPQKKSVVIFAGNVPADSDLVGITATVDAAVRAGVSFYGIDAIGLVAKPPLGDATTASNFGTAVLAGTAMAQDRGTIRDQELLYALAHGTGGRAFFDSNDFERPFRTLENDTSEYYILSYRTSNLQRDGHFRRISVRVHRRGIALKYQAGYYGPRAETPISARDAKRVLNEELAADLPATRLPVFGFVNQLRVAKDLFYVPITFVLPPEALLQNGTPHSALVGLVVMDDHGRPVRKLRDLIPAGVVAQHPARAVQYQTATELPAGDYTVRLVAVQNDTGQIGSFSTNLRLPQGDSFPLAVSSLFSGSLVAAGPDSPRSPFVLNGSRLMLNPLAEYGVKHSFTIQYDVACGAATHDQAICDARQIRSSLQCFSSDQRVFNAEPPAAMVIGDTAVFRVEFPARSLQPGIYKCRATAVNSQFGAFAFGATRIRIRDELANPILQAGSSEP